MQTWPLPQKSRAVNSMETLACSRLRANNSKNKDDQEVREARKDIIM